MSKKEAIEKIAGLLGNDVLSMSTTNNGSGLTTDSSVGSKDNSSAKGKITLEEFFARTDKVLLNIPTQEEFSALVKIFKDLGITTNSGREFKEGMWKNFEHLTIISPERKIGAGVESAKYYGYEVINFKDLDLEKYRLELEGISKTYEVLGIEVMSVSRESLILEIDPLVFIYGDEMILNNVKKVEQVTKQDFAKEVVSLLNKTSGINDQEKALFVQTLNFICSDKDDK